MEAPEQPDGKKARVEPDEAIEVHDSDSEDEGAGGGGVVDYDRARDLWYNAYRMYVNMNYEVGKVMTAADDLEAHHHLRLAEKSALEVYHMYQSLSAMDGQEVIGWRTRATCTRWAEARQEVEKLRNLHLVRYPAYSCIQLQWEGEGAPFVSYYGEEAAPKEDTDTGVADTAIPAGAGAGAGAAAAAAAGDDEE